MATKDEMMKAARVFWAPQKAGTNIHIADMKIRVAIKHEGWRTIALGNRLVAGHWEAPDIHLLQLGAATEWFANKEFRAPFAELLYWIVAEARTGRRGQHGMMGAPNTITDLITVEYDKETGKTWLLGELYDDRVEIKSEWEPEPFRIGEDGLHARWMDGHETWLELSADPMEEYNRIFRRPIEVEEVPEIPTTETSLGKIQAAIDAIEREIRVLRARERDFNSPNIEVAERLGKREEYERLLEERDEAMWRGNPSVAVKHAL